MILLHSLLHVVHLMRTDERGQSKNCRGQIHRRLVIEHTLGVHQQHADRLARRQSHGIRFRIHPDAGGLAFGPPAPSKGRFVAPDAAHGTKPEMLFLFRHGVALLHQDGGVVVARFAHAVQFRGSDGSFFAFVQALEIVPEPGQQKRFAGAKGSHHRHDGHFVVLVALVQYGPEGGFVQRKFERRRTGDAHYLDRTMRGESGRWGRCGRGNVGGSDGRGGRGCGVGSGSLGGRGHDA
mmetsp:Transcript_37072/g.86487  ORF Transcript_37072/g.86487 Transcript_37072/m.86487 type:complete len:237 (+) Transcript_37072:1642-2352(+)